MKIYVIGYLGSGAVAFGKKLALEKGYDFFSLDEEAEKSDGRTIKKLSMMMGEHAYRNEEYQALANLNGLDNIVVACGDGAPLDNMSFDLMQKGHVIVLDKDVDELWDNAKDDDTIPYAFMYNPDDEIRKEKFSSLHKSRLELYERLKAGSLREDV